MKTGKCEHRESTAAFSEPQMLHLRVPSSLSSIWRAAPASHSSIPIPSSDFLTSSPPSFSLSCLVPFSVSFPVSFPVSLQLSGEGPSVTKNSKTPCRVAVTASECYMNTCREIRTPVFICRYICVLRNVGATQSKIGDKASSLSA